MVFLVVANLPVAQPPTLRNLKMMTICIAKLIGAARRNDGGFFFLEAMQVLVFFSSLVALKWYARLLIY